MCVFTEREEARRRWLRRAKIIYLLGSRPVYDKAASRKRRKVRRSKAIR